MSLGAWSPISGIAAVGLLIALAGPSLADSPIIDGDLEFLRLVAMAQKSNAERLTTWQGTAHITHAHHFVPNAPSNRESEVLNVGAVSFAYEVSTQRLRWERTEEALRDPEANSLKDPSVLRFSRAILRPEGLYRYRGSPTGAVLNQMVIWSRDSEQARNPGPDDFDPRAYLRGSPVERGNLYDLLMTMYSGLKSPEARSTGKTQSVSIVKVSRDGNSVRLSLPAGTPEEAGTDFKFDMAQAGCMLSYKVEGPQNYTTVALSYQKQDGVIVPKLVEILNWKRSEDGSGYTARRTVEFISSTVNRPLDQTLFEPSTLGIQPGETVTDRRKPSTPLVFKYGVNISRELLNGVLAVLTTQPQGSRSELQGRPASSPVTTSQSSVREQRGLQTGPGAGTVRNPEPGRSRMIYFLSLGVLVLALVLLMIRHIARSRSGPA